MNTTRRGLKRKTLSLQAPAKVNLFLEILGRRPEGYHEVRTVLHAVAWRDRLHFRVRRSGIVLEGDGAELGRRNLIWKAARALQRKLKRSPGIEVRIEKRIPSAAGLGGGSSDAAATLRAMTRLHGIEEDPHWLAEVAASVGSDVPFFLEGGTALCTGRGQRVVPVVPGRPLDFVLVVPEAGLDTPAVYRAFKPSLTRRTKDATPFLRTWAEGEVRKLGRALFNRLEEPAFELAPELGQLKRRIAAMKPLGTLLSGSGSAFFALCADRSRALELADRLRRSGLRARAVRSERPGPSRG